MTEPLRFLIIDGYSKKSRDALQAAGMTLAWKLYVGMLRVYLPDAAYDVVLPSDPAVAIPEERELESYAGVLWTGCNLCINDTHTESVSGQIELARRAFRVGAPSFGSCWALQVAVVAAGGRVEANPRGREMGMARKIYLTEEGARHPMMAGRQPAFEAYSSHDDIVTQMPAGGVVLARNAYSGVQAAVIAQEKGVFWATQYHPEYTLQEMARLIVAREQKLVDLGFYRDHEDLTAHVEKLQALHAEPERKDLQWRLAIDDDVLTDRVRQIEFANWIRDQVRPGARG